MLSRMAAAGQRTRWVLTVSRRRYAVPSSRRIFLLNALVLIAAPGCCRAR
ncbi:hypothetical protein AB0G20_08940 [Streptomyces sp. NPDC024017]